MGAIIGANAGAGASRGQAGKMKAEGARPGIPDLFLAVPRGALHGLFIEMKRRKDYLVSPAQAHMAALLTERGYLVAVAAGFDQACKILADYLEGQYR